LILKSQPPLHGDRAAGLRHNLSQLITPIYLDSKGQFRCVERRESDEVAEKLDQTVPYNHAVFVVGQGIVPKIARRFDYKLLRG
jgi:hypothetical protein